MAHTKKLAGKKKTATLKSLTKKTNKNKQKITIRSKVKKVLPIPKGYHSITPYLMMDNAAKAIEFYKKAFGAKEVMRMEQSGEKITHAELKIGDSKIMLADACFAQDNNAVVLGNSPMGLHLYIKDVDAVVKRAVSVGATLIRPVEDLFYGDRAGDIQDPFGYRWHVATHIEDVTPAKIRRRAAELFGDKAKD